MKESETTTVGFEGRIVEFCRFARASGFNAGVKETADALESARAVGLEDRSAFKSALRATLCSSKEEWERFADLFEEFWGQSGAPNPGVKSGSDSVDSAGMDDGRSINDGRSMDDGRGMNDGRNRARAILSSGEANDADSIQEGKSVSGASALERMRTADFSLVPAKDLQDLERLAERLLGQMCLRLSRRLRIEQRGRVDLRRTIRASIARGGDPVDLNYKGHKKQQPRLVAFIDVSGSMELYSLFLLKFAFALHRHFRHVRTFIFSTRPVEVTEPLNARRLDKALRLLGETPAGWSGGTRIGESLAEINGMRGVRLLSRDTLFIIFSDGLETGDPKRLGAEMQAIKRKVRTVVWLNPLAAMENYQPLARGMSAALPYVDCFAAANSLESLVRLEKTLVPALLR